MIIESIEIRSFGRLRDFSCNFDEHFQIICGENETGKSTVAAFIRYMLYGFPAARGNDLAEKKKRISWLDGRAAGAMTVRLRDGKRYRIERNTTATTGTRERETYREVSAIIDLETNTPLPGNESAGERFLGVPEQVFLHTAFVGQLGSPRVGGPEVSEAIENLLSAGNEDTNVPRALQRIDVLRRSLLYKNGRGGLIHDLEGEEAALLARIEAAQKGNAALLEKEAELKADARSLFEADNELAQAVAAERETRNALLIHSYNRLRDARAVEESTLATLHEMDGMPAYHMTDKDIEDLRVARRHAEEMQATYRVARQAREACTGGAPLSPEDRARLEEVEGRGGLALLRERLAKRRRATLLPAVLTLPSLLVLIVGFFLSAPLSYALMAAGAVAAVAFAALAVTGLLSCRSLYRENGVANAKELSELLARLDRGQEELSLYTKLSFSTSEKEKEALLTYNNALGELDIAVGRFGARLPEDESEIPAFLDALEENARRVMGKKSEYDDLLRAAREDIARLSDYLAGTDEQTVRASISPDKLPPLDRLQNINKLSERREFFDREHKKLEDKHRKTEREVAELRHATEDILELRALLDDTRVRLANLREQYEASVLAYDAISGAGEKLRDEIAPRLSNFSCQMIERLTEGKYRRLGVANDLSVNVETEAGTYSLDYMSAGTQDLVYLALRMALVDLLYAEKPPVCFDESFVHQDDARTARMLEALYLLSEGAGQQNLLFTCHGREEALFTEKFGAVPVLRLNA